jgi:hypothetical protein
MDIVCRQMLAGGLLLLMPFLAHADDVDAVRGLLARTFDKPDSKLVSGPIAMEKAYAIADWMQGESGGRALLRREDAGWQIISCGGASIRTLKTLIDAGLAKADAETLLLKLQEAEQGLSAEHLHAFDHFRGQNKHH